MANTTTSRYAFVKPEIGAATDTWGNLLNTNWDDADSQLLRKLDKTLVEGVSQSITIADNNSRITTATTKGFQNVGVGDRIFISGSDASGGANNGIHTVTAVDTTNWLYVDCSGSTFVDDGAQTMTWGVVTKMKIDSSPGIDNTPIGANTASTGAFTTISASGTTTLNGDVDLGNAATDTITATAQFDSDLVPSTDDARDLGSSSKEWRNLYIDGTAYIDAAEIGSINASGGAGIQNTPVGTTTAAAGGFTTLTSSDDAQLESLGVGTAASGTTGEIRCTNNITAYYSSDKRLKDNIQPIPDALQKIDSISGVSFDWDENYIKSHGGEDDYFLQKHDIGVIAQEIQSVLPEVVREREDGYLAVKYEGIVPLLIQAIKELKKEVEELKK